MHRVRSGAARSAGGWISGIQREGVASACLCTHMWGLEGGKIWGGLLFACWELGHTSPRVRMPMERGKEGGRRTVARVASLPMSLSSREGCVRTSTLSVLCIKQVREGYGKCENKKKRKKDRPGRTHAAPGSRGLGGAFSRVRTAFACVVVRARK